MDGVWNEPSALVLGTFHSINAHKPQTNNVTNTDDPELDQLIETYRNSLDEEERIKLSLIIQQKIHEIGAFVPEAHEALCT